MGQKSFKTHQPKWRVTLQPSRISKWKKKNYASIASELAETRAVAEGSMAPLIGIKSTDLDGDKLTLSWSQLPGLKVELNSKHASDTDSSLLMLKKYRIDF